jgi:hypothetical protein
MLGKFAIAAARKSGDDHRKARITVSIDQGYRRPVSQRRFDCLYSSDNKERLS